MRPTVMPDFPSGTISRGGQNCYFAPLDQFSSMAIGVSVRGVVSRLCPRGRIMNKRAPVPKFFSGRATTILLIIILLPFAIVALSWAFEYVSRAM
jgi:hypothetical protein